MPCSAVECSSCERDNVFGLPLNFDVGRWKSNHGYKNWWFLFFSFYEIACEIYDDNEDGYEDDDCDVATEWTEAWNQKGIKINNSFNSPHLIMLLGLNYIHWNWHRSLYLQWCCKLYIFFSSETMVIYFIHCFRLFFTRLLNQMKKCPTLN